MHNGPKGGFFRRLIRDTTANTLAISAAAVLPMIGVIGGGVDASRMYMAKSRLQQACDSATLAARKKLGADSLTNGVIPSEIEETADNFFDANFQTGTYGTKDTEYALSAPVGTRLDGVASTSIPTTLMAVFGFEDVEIDVECSADLNLPNIDIVLVLDNSGSMRNSRIVALKDAAFAFYDEIMAVKPEDARVRIGIVPYSGGVNVGDMIMDLNSDYIADRWTYQSREPKFTSVLVDPGHPGSPGTEESTQLISDIYDWIPKPASNLGSTNFSGNGSSNHFRWRSNANHNQYGRDDCENDYPGTYQVGSETWIISNLTFYNNAWGNSGNSSWRGACYGRIQKYRVTPGSPPIPPRPPVYDYVFDRYEYKPIVFDTSLFKQGGVINETFAYVDGNRVRMPTGNQGAMASGGRWGKCIEETTTVAATNFNPIPAGANDLNIDLVPDASDPDTQWRPAWPEVTYNRGGPAVRTVTHAESQQTPFTNAWRLVPGNCPEARAWPLQEYDMDGSDRNQDFENRINAMTAISGQYTMHDLGMIWGGRMISPDGIFSATNSTAPNGEPISRHVIFMTDGLTEVSTGVTHGYGNYDMDGRFAGFAADGTWSTSDLLPIHNARLGAVCGQIKNKNVTLWTITFGLPQNANTRNCASGDSRAFESDNRDELIANFRAIATNIAELRLVR